MDDDTTIPIWLEFSMGTVMAIMGGVRAVLTTSGGCVRELDGMYRGLEEFVPEHHGTPKSAQLGILCRSPYVNHSIRSARTYFASTYHLMLFETSMILSILALKRMRQWNGHINPARGGE